MDDGYQKPTATMAALAVNQMLMRLLMPPAAAAA
jgi:hypothetical protein